MSTRRGAGSSPWQRVRVYLGLATSVQVGGRRDGAGATGTDPSVSSGPAADAAGRGDALVVIVVFAPDGDAADAVRHAAARAGAGAIGVYRACSFSAPGEGRFEPQAGANPAVGRVGRAEVVQEQRIEVVCPRRLALCALDAMLAAHPYEEPAHHVYETLSRGQLAARFTGAEPS